MVRLAETPPQAAYDEATSGRDKLRTQLLAVAASEGTSFHLAPTHLPTTSRLARLGELRPTSVGSRQCSCIVKHPIHRRDARARRSHSASL